MDALFHGEYHDRGRNRGWGFFMDWHRLFGLILTDFFTDSPFVVELEKDLALKRQL